LASRNEKETVNTSYRIESRESTPAICNRFDVSDAEWIDERASKPAIVIGSIDVARMTGVFLGSGHPTP
jgi:hypothetical protein